MIFSSYIFMFVFFPLVFCGYFLLSKCRRPMFQHAFLVAASLVFYGWDNPKYVFIIVTSILLNYFLSFWLAKESFSNKTRKALFILGIVFNIGILGFFKYTDFVISNVNFLTGSRIESLNLVFPLGISFFTFQQFSFIVSCYKNKTPCRNFINYALFVSFFPQLIAGPIVLYEEMMPQFQEEKRRRINAENVIRGLAVFASGFFKKIVLADTFAVLATNGFSGAGSLSFLPAWIAVFAYAFQIYFDFSGYCDMAIGGALMLNIELPLNFNAPYRAKNVREFWRRWHITLGRALTTYVYIPLGGNRKGNARTYLNLMATFLISGLWHGPAWTFVVWGALHGFANIFDRVFEKQQEKIPAFLRQLVTFLFVTIAWVLFRAQSWGQAGSVYKAMFAPRSMGGFSEICALFYDGYTNLPQLMSFAMICLIFLVGVVWVVKEKNAKSLAADFRITPKSAILLAVVYAFAILHLTRLSPFIYFNF
ncbi:MAG: MBOAT family protein [Clostridia bacterium]|nr:MBOAT family protein [Clostridia bacterium]